MDKIEKAIEKVAEALWRAIDDDGIQGRLYREDCDYLATVAVAAMLGVTR